MSEPAWVRWGARLSLPSLRATVRSAPYHRLWALAAATFAVISVFVGQMVIFFPQDSEVNHQPIHVYTYTSTSQISNPYLLPSVLVTAPHLVLTFAFWPTLVMAMISVGVGLAVSSTVALFVVQRQRRADITAGGAAPIVTGGALLGACCCTSCAAQAATVGVLGAASGASGAQLIAQSWPLGLFQIVVLAVSLLYMERELEGRGAPTVRRPASTARKTGAVVLRIGLLLGAITWLFAFILEWSSGGDPVTPPLLYHWVFEHWVLGLLAIACALGPVGLWGWVERHPVMFGGARVIALLAGITWGIGVPPLFSDIGLGGTLNEMLGYVGAPAGWGAIPPDSPLGAALVFHWSIQHILLGGWAIVVALAPTLAFSTVSPDARPAPQGMGEPTPRPPPTAVETAPSD